MNKEQNLKELYFGLAWGVSIVAVALVATFARKLGYVDGETVTRLVMSLNGLMIAWYGNRMPKTFVPSARARQAKRVAAWSLALSGLIYAGLWLLAPMPIAIWLGSGTVVAGLVVSLGYCVSLRLKTKAA